MFRISLPSNASSEYFPKNTPSNYRVKMPHIFNSTKKYECALSEIIFPNKFKNVRKGLNNIEVEVGSEKIRHPVTIPQFQLLFLKLKVLLNRLTLYITRLKKEQL